MGTPQQSYYPKGWKSEPAGSACISAGYLFVEAGPSLVADPVLLSQVLQSGSAMPDYWFLLLAC